MRPSWASALLAPAQLERHNLLVDLFDTLQRPLRDLRISVTDRCNYRCNYCMPFDEYVWSERSELLSFEEIRRLAALFLGMGVSQIRLTGGEPLVRQELESLISSLTALEGLQDLSLTTNGSLLREKAAPLRAAGLRRINVSLDTLNPSRFAELTRRGELGKVLAGIDAARREGFSPIKINTVVIKGTNDDEILDLVDYSRANGLEIRFIEYMDVGNANNWSLERTVPKQQILDVIRSRHELQEVGRNAGRAPAVDYMFADGHGRVGVIGSVTEPFCSSCSRARITADGRFVTCLFSETGFDLKSLLRSGANDEELRQAISAVWLPRSDRYSDKRWNTLKSGKPYKAGKKIEMITLGG